MVAETSAEDSCFLPAVSTIDRKEQAEADSDTIERAQKRKCLRSCGIVLDRLFARRWCQVLSILSFILLILCVAFILAIVVVLFGGAKDSSGMTFKYSSMNLSQIYSNSSNETIPGVGLTPTGKATPYASCDSDENLVTVHGVYSTFCDERTSDNRCRMKVGSLGHLEVLFSPRSTITAPRARQCGRLVITSGFALVCASDVDMERDACSGYNLQCPLEANKVYLYRASDRPRLLPGMQKVTINTEMSVLDDNSHYVFCITIPVFIEA